ncbi:MAG TPA: FG-GAP repeat protein [Phycisphaerae bacterium]|nr:FG-GAP repeat protein [Phycisphaerae bacterium]HRW54045.1 FG-GAP repeat protein [Phycisphaerae bacterium]
MHQGVRIISVILPLALIGLTRQAFAQCQPTFSQKLIAGDASEDDGFSVCAVSGDTAIIGAPQEDNAGGVDAGAAYVFRREFGVWQEVAKLTADDAAEQAEFGNAIAIEGDTAFIAAHDRSPGGGVYVFRETDGVWGQIALLTATDTVSVDDFGRSVALVGDTIFVGAPRTRNQDGFFEGAAYVFREVNGVWTQTAKVEASDASRTAEFGFSIAADAGVLVVGAFQHRENNITSGAAWVFEEDQGGWSQIQKILPPNPEQNDRFGVSVGVHAGTIAIGASGEDFSGHLESGAVYLYQKPGGLWHVSATLASPADQSSDFFGGSLAILNDTIVVSMSPNTAQLLNGSSVIFQRINNGWRQVSWIDAFDGAYNDDFGWPVAMDGNVLVAGAPGDDDGAPDAGAAYVFNLNPSPFDCNANGFPDDCETIGGGTPDCNGNLIPDECDIANFFSIDCDANGVPDECELNAANGHDCNANGLPDACDIAAQTSFDCDGNGVPDECDRLAQVFADNPFANQQVGAAVSIRQEVAVVGALNDVNANSGAAHVFRQTDDDWTHEDKLVASNAAFNDHFGAAVAIDGNDAIVGAWGNNALGARAGAAYVFRATGSQWNQTEILFASDGQGFAQFGECVAMAGNTAVIGGPYALTSPTSYGKAYVFRRILNDWEEVTILPREDPENPNRFGTSVAIDGDAIVVGAPLDAFNGPDSGAAYVFRESGGAWSQEIKLWANDGQFDDAFGQSVAVSGDTIVIGAPGDDDNGVDSGSAYVFRKVGGVWSQWAKLNTFEGQAGDEFGRSVAIEGNAVVIGAPRAIVNNTDRGAVYVFRESEGIWQQALTLAPGVPGEADQFGTSVGLDGGRILAGAGLDSASASSAGSASIFQAEFAFDDCDANQIPDACEPPLGTIGDFVSALVGASSDPFDVCVFDANDDGQLDSRDVQPFVSRLIGD